MAMPRDSFDGHNLYLVGRHQGSCNAHDSTTAKNCLVRNVGRAEIGKSWCGGRMGGSGSYEKGIVTVQGETTQAWVRTVIIVVERNRQIGEIMRIYLVPG